MKYLFLLLPFLSFTQLERDSIAIQFSQYIDTADIREHIFTLASDEYEGRLTGTKGQKMAATYLASHFNSFGIPALNESYFQKYPIIKEENKSMSVSIGNTNYEIFVDFYPINHLLNITVHFDEAVFAGYGVKTEDYNDYEDIDVKDKVVFVWEGEPLKNNKYWISNTSEESNFGKHPMYKTELIEKYGAKALFIIEEEFPHPGLFQWNRFYEPTIKLYSENAYQPRLPVLYVSQNIANQVFTDKNLLKLKSKIDKKFKPKSFVARCDSSQLVSSLTSTKTTAENVIGYIEGRDKKDELIVISGHFDHIGKEGDKIYNGADDNGSGSSALIEIAEAFQKAKEAGYGPNRSILILPFSGEENGLLGSRYYAENPLFPFENTIANLNIDMIGRVDEVHENDSNYVYLIGSNFISQELHDLSEEVNKTYTNLNLDYTYNSKTDPNRFYYRSDHYNFAKNGVPAIFYFNGTHEDYHKPSDTPDKISIDLIKKRADLIFFTAWELAK